jgi:hypothetical protein
MVILQESFPPTTPFSSSSLSSRTLRLALELCIVVLLMIFSIKPRMDYPIAGAATLANRSRRRCDGRHTIAHLRCSTIEVKLRNMHQVLIYAAARFTAGRFHIQSDRNKQACD